MSTKNGGGFWAMKKHGESGSLVVVWVVSVNAGGVARFIKANPWVFRVKAGVRDARAGWTKPMTCRAAELLTVRTTLDRKQVDELVAAIGEPGGWGVKKPKTLKPGEWWVTVLRVHQGSGVRAYELAWTCVHKHSAVGTADYFAAHVAADVAERWYNNTDQAGSLAVVEFRLERWDGRLFEHAAKVEIQLCGSVLADWQRKLAGVPLAGGGA